MRCGSAMRSHAQRRGSPSGAHRGSCHGLRGCGSSISNARGGQPIKRSFRVLTPAQARVLWDDVVARSALAAGSAQSLQRRAARRAQLASAARLPHPARALRAFESPEAQALHAWCTRIRERCDALGAIDEARLPLGVRCRLRSAERLAFAGFDALPPAMARLIERWRAAGIVARHRQLKPQRATTLRSSAQPMSEAEIELAAQWARDRSLAGASARRRDRGRTCNRDAKKCAAYSRMCSHPGARHTKSAAVSLPVDRCGARSAVVLSARGCGTAHPADCRRRRDKHARRAASCVRRFCGGGRPSASARACRPATCARSSASVGIGSSSSDGQRHRLRAAATCRALR